MVKLLWRFGLLVLAAIAFSWLADRHDTITINTSGKIIQFSALVGVILLASGLAALYFIWRILHKIWRTPSTAREHLRFRKHRKAYDSLSRGIIAAGAGDAQAAARHAGIARETLKNEPLLNLLTAQAAQLRGDRTAVKLAFNTMLDTADTELLGLRGLFAEAKQSGDWSAARNIAERALAKNPRLPWASTAVLQAQLSMKDWFAAAKTIANQSKAGILPREEAAVKQAALLTAQALKEETESSVNAQAHALEAHKLDPSLVPAALVAARIYVAQNNPRKAAKLLRSTWALSPHAELAEVMEHLKPGDGPEERFERVRDLVGKPETSAEAAFSFARAAISAQRFDVARSALQAFVDDRPQARICGLLAEIEEAQGDKGRSREWLARALHAPRDPIWVSDGVASARWTPISPATGEIVMCEWKPPFEMATGTQRFTPQAVEIPMIEAQSEKPQVIERARLPDDPGID